MNLHDRDGGARRPVVTADLSRLRFLMGADLAADGRSVVYALSRTDVERNTDYTDLYRLDTQSREAVPLTRGDAVNVAPAFSPDGRSIAFLSSRNGLPQIFVMPAEGGEPRQVTSLPRGAGGGPVWSPDGACIAFSAGAQGEPRDRSKPYRVKRTIWRADGIGVVEDALQDIYIVGAEGGEPRRITNDAFMNTNPVWSQDGASILYTASFDPDGPHSVISQLRSVRLASGEITDIVRSGMLLYVTCRDGRIVYMNAFEPGTRPGTKHDLWVFDPISGKHERRTAALESGIGGILQPDMPTVATVMGKLLLSEDETHVFAQVQRGGEVAIFKIALSGPEACEPVAQGQRLCAPFGVRSGQLLFSATSLVEPGDLYALDLKTNAERRLTQLNEELLAQWQLPAIRRVTYASTDGAGVEGWFLAPADAKAPHPTVLAIHGGPHAAWGYVFNFDFLMLVGGGFAVLAVNYRGSTGYGSAFATLNYDGTHRDYDDLMAGVDHVIASGLADAERLGVCGISAGGTMTGWVIGHTQRFKAACPENPIFNLLSAYGSSDAGTWSGDAELGGKPYERREIYEMYSPIYSAHHCTTPTLFLQHEDDFRCPAEQSEQYYMILKMRGVPAEMLRFPGTAHHGSLVGPISHRQAQNEALLEWMTRYVLGEK